jgi:ferric-dicitrate binding protein FerR (iron transport regulator)
VVAGKGGSILDGEILSAGTRHQVFQGQQLVVPRDSSAQLELGDGVEVAVLPEARVSVDFRMVFLKTGKVHAKVRPGVGNFVVHGPQASAWVVGTEFEVSAGTEGTQVQVQKGIVEVRTRSKRESTQLLAGGSAQVRVATPSKLEIQGPHREAEKPLQVRPTDDGPVEAAVSISEVQASNPEGLPDLDSN